MPRIGITCSHFEWPQAEDNQVRLKRYVDAVDDAGARGELLWLPQDLQPDDTIAHAALAARLATQLDGLMISGGADLPAAAYGETEYPEAKLKPVVPQRPAFEKALLPAFLERGKPVLGICYGCQFINVWRGGTLIQDIPLQCPQAIQHGDSRHVVQTINGSRLQSMIGTEAFASRSSHHQAVARLAPDARLAALAPDGIIEALEFADAPFFLGVQWHPECDRDSDATQRLMAAFVAACPA